MCVCVGGGGKWCLGMRGKELGRWAKIKRTVFPSTDSRKDGDFLMVKAKKKVNDKDSKESCAHVRTKDF